MKKKSIGALLLSVSLLIGATGATTAYFTNTVNTNTQSITLGNLQIAFTPANGTHKWTVTRGVANLVEAWENNPLSLSNLPDVSDNGYDEIAYSADYNSISNLAPGDALVKNFILKNTGSLDAKVSFSLENLEVSKYGVVYPSDTTTLPGGNIQFKAYTVDADNNPVNEVKLSVGALPGQYILDAKSHETIAVVSMVLLDKSMDNGGMDKKISFDVKADATQWNNKGWGVN